MSQLPPSTVIRPPWQHVRNLGVAHIAVVRTYPRELSPMLHSMPDTEAFSVFRPSAPLLSAALSGLLSVALGACDDDTKSEPKPADTNGLDASTPAADAGMDATTPSEAADAAGKQDDAGVSSRDASRGDAGTPVNTLPVVTQEIPGQRTLASLEAECEELGGMMQIHAACAGSNSCKGFSYGDWGEGATLTEHTCAGLNGCNGASCVVLPRDSGKTGPEVYAGELPPAGPSSCTNCHGVWNEGDGGSEVDTTKFRLWLVPGSTRNETNWLDLSEEAQAGIVAFGKGNTLADGSPIVSMMGYHKLYARAEIERVVEFIRTLTPVVSEIQKPK